MCENPIKMHSVKLRGGLAFYVLSASESTKLLLLFAYQLLQNED